MPTTSNDKILASVANVSIEAAHEALKRGLTSIPCRRTIAQFMSDSFRPRTTTHRIFVVFEATTCSDRAVCTKLHLKSVIFAHPFSDSFFVSSKLQKEWERRIASVKSSQKAATNVEIKIQELVKEIELLKEQVPNVCFQATIQATSHIRF